jgi:hypothetical protein
MPRFNKNRWWTFILTLAVLAAVSYARPGSSLADIVRGELQPGVGISDPGSGSPGPVGAGDPDQPVATSLKKWRGGPIGTGNGYLSMHAVGDSRYVGVSNVWMLRLSVLAQAMRVYWVR